MIEKDESFKLGTFHQDLTSPRMPRHIRELCVCAGAKIQNRLEKSANNNKEYGQKAGTSVYAFLFHGHIYFSGQRVHMEIVEKGSINDSEQKLFL